MATESWVTACVSCQELRTPPLQSGPSPLPDHSPCLSPPSRKPRLFGEEGQWQPSGEARLGWQGRRRSQSLLDLPICCAPRSPWLAHRQVCTLMLPPDLPSLEDPSAHRSRPRPGGPFLKAAPGSGGREDPSPKRQVRVTAPRHSSTSVPRTCSWRKDTPGSRGPRSPETAHPCCQAGLARASLRPQPGGWPCSWVLQTGCQQPLGGSPGPLWLLLPLPLLARGACVAAPLPPAGPQSHSADSPVRGPQGDVKRGPR